LTTSVSLVERLFHEASALSGAAREGFLRGACGEDRELRREVEALLALDERPDARLDRPAPEALGLSPAPASLLTGRALGPYRLVRRLASGGMGAIYEAEQENPRRTVAVKVLRSDLTGEDLERRFRFEASFLARLQHPAIAHVYEAGVADLDGQRVPWIAMELIEGARTITAYAREEGLDLSARLALFAEVCDAVHHGHQRGVIHRDLKPANVLVDRAGRPKLIDFGIARAVDPARATYRTEAGALLGTVEYMSPEQCVDARDLDVRSDVYSLGVVLYELACGRLPHALEGVALPELVRIVREEPPLRPSSLLRDLRGDIEAVLLTALEPDRARRYQSAAALAEDLRRHLRHEPIEARAPSRFRRAALFARRNRTLVGSLAAVFVAALLAAVVSARFAWRERQARASEERSSTLANIAAADLSLRAHDAAGARRQLERIPAGRRGWEWRYLWGQLDQARTVLRGPQLRCEALDARGGVLAASWHFPESSWITLLDPLAGTERARIELARATAIRLALAPDGSVIWGGEDGALRRWDPDTGRTAVFEGGHQGGGADVTAVRGVCVTASGIRAVSAARDGTVRVWDTASRRTVAVLGDGRVPWRDLELSADGRLAAVGGEDGAAHVFGLDAAGEEIVLRGSESHVLAVAFHPDGARLAAGAGDGVLRLWDLAARAELRRFTGHEGEVQDLAFCAGGELLVSAGSDRTVRVWDVELGIERAVLHGHEALVKCLAYPAEGPALVSGGYDGSVRVWDLDEVLGGRVDRHQGYVRDLAFAPGGKRLATASFDRTVEVIDTDTWQVSATLAGHEDRVTSLAFHPEGALLASSSNDGAVRVWDARTGELLRTLREHADGVLTLAFAPSGDRLASGGHDRRVLLRALEDLAVCASLEHEQVVEQLAFDPSGNRLAVVVQDGGLTLWDVQRARELWRRPSLGRLHDVAFSPDGERIALAVGDYDGTDLGIHLVDACTGADRGLLGGHTDVVLCVAFEPSGQRLASGAMDGTIRLWDLEAGEEVLVLRGHESWVYAVAFSPDGSLLASGGGRESGAGVGVRVWRAGPGR
jgi:WD40 repeat protein